MFRMMMFPLSISSPVHRAVGSSRRAVPAFLASVLIAFGLVAFGLVVACVAVPAAWAADGDAPTVADAIRDMFDGRDDDTAMARFYRDNGYRPLWMGPSGASGAATLFLKTVAGADRDGLDPADYPIESLQRRMESAQSSAELAALDVAFSRALVAYAGDLQRGRARAVRAAETGDDAAAFGIAEQVAVLQRAAHADDFAAFLDDLAPANREYRSLRRALAAYRAIEAQGGWPRLKGRQTLRRGMYGSEVAVLRHRLAATGDLKDAGEDPRQFDGSVEQAVRAFQARHGLAVDGVVGPRTRAALNVPVELRVRQLLINLERARWLTKDFGQRYLIVNLADFRLRAIDGGRTVLDMRVVVGLPYRSTPVFSDEVTYVHFNPYWNVPPSIAKKDILPRVKRDPGYLVRRSIRVFSDWSGNARELDPWSIDWSRFNSSYFPYKLRQDPGPQNPLGRVKFMFPNKYSVYLHDTPSRGLFDHPVRAFSSGCIRVEKPVDLAAFLLGDDPKWTTGTIAAAMAGNRSRAVSLPRPVPVHLTYATAWVGDHGEVHFRGDIYERDARLSDALFGDGNRGNAG